MGHETIDGRKCAKLDYDDAFVEVRLWIPETGQPLPRRLEIVYKTSPALPVSQIDFTNWNMDATVVDSVGMELGRASFRRGVTSLTLSVARWVHIPAMTTFPEAPR